MKGATQVRQLQVLVLLVAGGAALPPQQRPALVRAPGDDAVFELNLLHINDMHARYEETNKYSGTCSERDSTAGSCFGGYARVATLMKEARAQEQSGGPHSIILNAGDTYQGTVYYSVFRWNISSSFMNKLNFDAITLGNHEFDDHTAGLEPYLKALTVPVVIANADFSRQPELAALDIKKSVVIEKAGTKIGIIGYLTPDTAFLSNPDQVTFQDEIEALTAEAARLKRDGVNIIIGLGHSGYQKDQEIAAQVPDIDVVVGGHSHSFLYTGDQPDVDVPVGLYPTWVTQPSTGHRVPVLQAYAYTKYMGKVALKFDANGNLLDMQGGPILLNNQIEQDPETLAEVLRWKSELAASVMQPIGRTSVFLDGTNTRREESNLGNLIADAFVFARAEFLRLNDSWTDAPIGLVNGGSIRTSIDASPVNGTITIKDVMEVLPFDNLQVVLKLRGSVLLEALEHGVSEYLPGSAWKGGFLQVSGLRVTYDVSRPAGQRVVSVLARCGKCLVPRYSALDREAVYGVVLSTFLANGGDGFTMLNKTEGSEVLQDTDAHVMQHYIEKRGLVYPAVEGRISFVTEDGGVPSSAPPQPPTQPAQLASTPSTSRATGSVPATVLSLLALASLVRAV